MCNMVEHSSGWLGKELQQGGLSCTYDTLLRDAKMNILVNSSARTYANQQ